MSLRRKKPCENCGKDISLSNYDKHYVSCINENKKEKLFVIKQEWEIENGEYQCPICNKVYTKMGMVNHYYRKHTEEGKKLVERICEKNEFNVKGKIVWNKGLTKETDIRVKKQSDTYKNKIKEGKIIIKRGKHTTETKNIMSNRRKEWLRKNPDKHPWKRNDKFKSIPCEEFKNFLKENKIEFSSDYEPLDNRFFAIDIAFPYKKIGIEINGNQHYNKDKSLKPYYQERHDLIESNNWKIYEIHYSLVYKEDFKDKILKTLKKDLY